MNKTLIRFFTIADYEDEENWLREQHKIGLKLVKMIIPCFYIFEECEPEDVIYRLDFQSDNIGDDYLKMLEDFGWEHFAQCLSWNYFRKKAADVSSKEEGELFSDNGSKLELISSVITTRYIPLLLIFAVCVMPNIVRIFAGEINGPWSMVLSVIFCLLFVIYIYLILHCGIKLLKLKGKYSDQ